MDGKKLQAGPFPIGGGVRGGGSGPMAAGLWVLKDPRKSLNPAGFSAKIRRRKNKNHPKNEILAILTPFSKIFRAKIFRSSPACLLPGANWLNPRLHNPWVRFSMNICQISWMSRCVNRPKKSLSARLRLPKQHTPPAAHQRRNSNKAREPESSKNMIFWQ